MFADMALVPLHCCAVARRRFASTSAARNPASKIDEVMGGDRFREFLGPMSSWVTAGEIKFREDIVDGLENAPQAFLGLLQGRNFGKLVVRVAND